MKESNEGAIRIERGRSFHIRGAYIKNDLSPDLEWDLGIWSIVMSEFERRPGLELRNDRRERR